jgi:hypothetical protein
VPKKSRRDRKRTQQRGVAQSSETPTAPTEVPLMEFTDFSQPQTTPVVTETPSTAEPARDEEIESILAAEDAARRFQQISPRVLATGGQGVSEPEVAQALRRVQRKTGAKTPLRPARPVSQPPLPPESAAIPLALVPYVMSDLRRVAFSAVIISIFIVVSGVVVTHLVH